MVLGLPLLLHAETSVQQQLPITQAFCQKPEDSLAIPSGLASVSTTGEPECSVGQSRSPSLPPPTPWRRCGILHSPIHNLGHLRTSLGEQKLGINPTTTTTIASSLLQGQPTGLQAGPHYNKPITTTANTRARGSGVKRATQVTVSPNAQATPAARRLRASLPTLHSVTTIGS